VSEEINRLKSEEKEKENDQVRPRARAATGHSAVVPGLALILVGAVFLMMNVTGAQLHNWWALFIMIPVFGSLAHAWERYQKHGRLTRSARSSIGAAFFFSFLAAVFLLGLSWNYIWPLLLIFLGIKALLANV
jgi:hypothetical protein